VVALHRSAEKSMGAKLEGDGGGGRHFTTVQLWRTWTEVGERRAQRWRQEGAIVPHRLTLKDTGGGKRTQSLKVMARGGKNGQR